MKFTSPRRLIPQNTPIYRLMPEYDAILIGLNHDEQAVDQYKVEFFKRVVAKTQYLLCEADINQIERRKVKNTYEGLAVREFRGPIYALEEGLDYVDLLRSYGLGSDFCGLYRTMESFDHITNLVSTTGADRNTVTKFLLNLLKERPTYRSLDVDGAYKYAASLNASPEFTSEVAARISDEYEMFSLHIRDFDIMGPEIRRLCSMLHGSKAVLTGALHTDSLVRFLRGESEPPQKWADFVDNLHPEIRTLIRNVENGMNLKP